MNRTGAVEATDAAWRAAGQEVSFEDAAHLLKALAHPLRLRLVCGLCREPSNLTRIVANLSAPLSTVALHLAVLRRAGILTEEKTGAEIIFHLRDPRTRRVLEAFCRPGSKSPLDNWNWESLARSLGSPPPGPAGTAGKDAGRSPRAQRLRRRREAARES